MSQHSSLEQRWEPFYSHSPSHPIPSHLPLPHLLLAVTYCHVAMSDRTKHTHNTYIHPSPPISSHLLPSPPPLAVTLQSQSHPNPIHPGSRLERMHVLRPPTRSQPVTPNHLPPHSTAFHKANIGRPTAILTHELSKPQGIQ